MSEKQDDMPDWPSNPEIHREDFDEPSVLPQGCYYRNDGTNAGGLFCPDLPGGLSIARSTRIVRSQRKRMNAEMRGAGARLSFMSGSGTLEGSRIQVGNPEDLGMRGSFLRDCSVTPPYCLRRRLFRSDQDLESELEAGVR